MTSIIPKIGPNVLAVANGSPPSASLFFSLIQKATTLVAIDGGLETFHKYKVKPHIITGDLDSVDKALLESYQEVCIKKMPDQNENDLEKAIKFLFKFPLESLTVLGALGKRLDHELTNLLLLCKYPDKLKFESELEECFILPKKFQKPCKVGQKISLIPMGAVSEVSSKGLKWNINKQNFDKNFFSLSNYANSQEISISHKSGDLLICIVK